MRRASASRAPGSGVAGRCERPAPCPSSSAGSASWPALEAASTGSSRGSSSHSSEPSLTPGSCWSRSCAEKRQNEPMRRSDQRRDAVFASYQRDITGRPLEELVADAKPLTRELAEGVDANREELDDAIAAHLRSGWTIDPLP